MIISEYTIYLYSLVKFYVVISSRFIAGRFNTQKPAGCGLHNSAKDWWCATEPISMLVMEIFHQPKHTKLRKSMSLFWPAMTDDSTADKNHHAVKSLRSDYTTSDL